MKEIKAGQYVRTKTGRIYKLGYYNEEEGRWICVTDEDWFPVYESEIVKHSFDIIYLIKEGDYVNDMKITYIKPADICGDEELDYPHIYYKDSYNQELKEIYRDKIKTIVTCEMIESIKYEVK